MKQQRKTKLISLLLSLVLLLSALGVGSASANGLFAGGEGPVIANLSLKDGVGYYMLDNQLYRYTAADGASAAVSELPASAFTDASYVLYDGETVYVADERSVVTAYRTSDWSKRWTSAGLGDWAIDGYDDEWNEAQFFCQVNADMVLRDGELILYCYTYTYYRGYASIVRLNAATGEQISREDKGNIAYAKQTESRPVVAGNRILFGGSTYAGMDLETGEAWLETPFFDNGFVYDSGRGALVGMSDGALCLAEFPFEGSEPGLKKFGFVPAGENPLFVMAGDIPLVFSMLDGKLVYEIFTGVELIRKDTGLAPDNIVSVSIDGTTAYVTDEANVIYKQPLELDGTPVHQVPSERAQAFDASIEEVLSSIESYNGPNLSLLTLEQEAAVRALDAEYQSLSEADKKGAINAHWVPKLKEQTDALRANLDQLNADIAALPSPKELQKDGVEAVKAAYNIYHALSAYDKTLADQALLRLMEKVAAFDVMDQISALPSPDEVALEDLPAVQGARRAYEAVLDEWKTDVANRAELFALEKKLKEMLEEREMEDIPYWSNSGGNNQNSGTVESKLPTSLEELVEVFRLEKSVQQPILVGNRLFLIEGSNQLVAYDVSNGQFERIAAAQLYEKIGFFSRIAYGGGNIYVALGDRVQAFDAQTLQPLWLTPSTGNQATSTITYHDGYLYTGVNSGGGGATGATNGIYFCVSTEDEDPDASYEVKDFTWTSQTGGYYWAGGAIAKNRIFFVGDSGMLYSHHLTQDIVYDSYQLDGVTRSNVVYDELTGRLIVGTKEGTTLYSIELNDDGTFRRDTIVSSDQFGGITGGVSVYQGRIYVPAGGMHAGSNGNFTVVDAATLEPVYTYKIGNFGLQSIPLICTAYASESNRQTVYVYVIDYEKGDLVVLEDCQGQTEAKEVARKTGLGTYNSSTVVGDAQGNLYVIGGSSWPAAYYLYVYRSPNAEFTADDLENKIDRLPDADHLTYSHKREVFWLKTRLAQFASHDDIDPAKRTKADALIAGMETIVSDLLSAAEQEIAKIPETVTLESEAQILTAETAYGRLDDADRQSVTGRNKLRAAQAALMELKSSVAGLVDQIEALPERDNVTLEDSARINELWSRYEALGDGDQVGVTNLQKLLDAKDKLQELTNMTLVDGIVADIDRLPSPEEITLASEQAVADLTARVEALHENAQKAVSNRENLAGLKSRLEGYRAAVEEIDALIWDGLDPMNITLADKETVETIAAKYAALRDAEKEYVRYYSDVTDAQQIIASLERGIIPAMVFENIMGTDSVYTAGGEGYSYSFAGSGITQPMDFDYSVSFDPAYPERMTGLSAPSFAFSTGQSGPFPGEGTLTLSVSLPDGQYTLYRLSEEGASEANEERVTVLGGKASLGLTTGGDYAIAEKPIDSGVSSEPSIPSVPSTPSLPSEPSVSDDPAVSAPDADREPSSRPSEETGSTVSAAESHVAPDNPKTGDAGMLWAVVLLAAGLCTLVLTKRGKSA